MSALPVGATIGIMGGGQLGRMLALAAAPLGFRCHIYCPDPESPAFDVAAEASVAPYDDAQALARFAAAVEVITFEFENVPVAPLRPHAALCRPGLAVLEAAQDRLAEKEHLSRYAPVAPHAAIDGPDDIAPAMARLSPEGGPFILKTRRFGYDGKGQAAVDPTDPAAAWHAIGAAPAILEQRIALAAEFSTIIARAEDGEAVIYEPARNRHEGGILRTSTVPGDIAPAARASAEAATRAFADALQVVGVVAVEWFLTQDGGVVANEMAPRVHNSGHWTMDGAATSQFENHIRAIAHWPLGRPERTAPTTMTNIIGEDGSRWRPALGESGVRLHLYGKREARPGRKMGHVNRIGD